MIVHQNFKRNTIILIVDEETLKDERVMTKLHIKELWTKEHVENVMKQENSDDHPNFIKNLQKLTPMHAPTRNSSS